MIPPERLGVGCGFTSSPAVPWRMLDPARLAISFPRVPQGHRPVLPAL